MDSAVAKNVAEPRSVDPVWAKIREAAQTAAATEPVLAGTLHATILSQPKFESALSYHLARLAGTTEVPAALIRQTFDEALTADPAIGLAARADIMAVAERDPACTSHLDPLLWFKGYHALQTSRVGHWLWLQGRQTLAHFLQSRASALFGLDIHPGARIGKGIFIDHGTGVVIGETAVVEDGVSMLHGVTLGGTGKERGDRHPKVRRGVLLGAGAKVLGNIEIGACAKIAAGSVVLEPVPAGCTAAGVPARIIGCVDVPEPALEMDQRI
ncbi:serine O-acetyltransferase [Rhodospirillales bacterium URHD0017]|nr:serine O-acetyltransferase [Rhodospirillales bacterium URHD0017]